MLVRYTTTANIKACIFFKLRRHAKGSSTYETKAKAMRGNEGGHRKSWPSPRYRQDRTLGRWWVAQTRVLVLVTQGLIQHERVSVACANNWNQLSELQCWSSFLFFYFYAVVFITFVFRKASASFLTVFDKKKKKNLKKKKLEKELKRTDDDTV